MDHPTLAVPPDVAQGSNLHYHNPILSLENSADCVAHQPAENCGFENSPSPEPRVTKIWRDVITHPAGASREVVINHEYVDWTDGAQTVRPNVIGGAWICVHAGTNWPDAVTECKHIYALGGAE